LDYLLVQRTVARTIVMDLESVLPVASVSAQTVGMAKTVVKTSSTFVGQL